MSESLPQGFIQGELVDLRPMTKELFQEFHPWMNDHRSRRLARHVLPVLEETTENWIQGGSNSPSGVVMGIWTKLHNDKEIEMIGFVSLFNIDWLNRHADLGLHIPNPKFWGKGYGKNAVQLICQYGFLELNIEKIISYVLEENIGSQKCMEYNKFQRDGILRNHIFLDGKYTNMILFTLLQSEWNKSLKNS